MRTPGRRTFVTVALAAAALSASLLAGVVDRGPARHPESVGDDSASALDLAREACDHYAAVIDLVNQNAPAPSVHAAVESLDRAASDAYRHEVAWLRLLSGARALRWSLEHDDAAAARAGVETLDAECRLVGDRRGS